LGRFEGFDRLARARIPRGDAALEILLDFRFRPGVRIFANFCGPREFPGRDQAVDMLPAEWNSPAPQVGQIEHPHIWSPRKASDDKSSLRDALKPERITKGD
jgi:hypothetical protein